MRRSVVGCGVWVLVCLVVRGTMPGEGGVALAQTGVLYFDVERVFPGPMAEGSTPWMFCVEAVVRQCVFSFEHARSLSLPCHSSSHNGCVIKSFGILR